MYISTRGTALDFVRWLVDSNLELYSIDAKPHRVEATIYVPDKNGSRVLDPTGEELVTATLVWEPKPTFPQRYYVTNEPQSEDQFVYGQEPEDEATRHAS